MKKTVLRITAVLAAVLLLAIIVPACVIAGSMDGRGEPTGEVLIVLLLGIRWRRSIKG